VPPSALPPPAVPLAVEVLHPAAVANAAAHSIQEPIFPTDAAERMCVFLAGGGSPSAPRL
jgi:hypothetical protein